MTTEVKVGDSPDSDKQPPEPAGTRMPSLSLDNILKLTALAGAVVYGALFTGYRAFYRAVGLNPEEVGINNTFILVRSVGFSIITALVAIAWFGATKMVREFRARHSESRLARWATSYGWNIAAGFVFSFFVTSLASPAWSGSVIIAVWVSVFILSVVLGFIAQRSSEDQRTIVGAILAVTVAIMLPTTAIYNKAVRSANSILAGHKVKPLTVFNIPILDVSSDAVHATWICPEAQKPPLFKEAKDSTITGMLIGESGTSYIIRVWKHPVTGPGIVRMPQNCAMVTRLGN
ncbi:hypothetical protein A5730_11455 [Mycobacterium sp. ACS4054]|uniref:hypothetical protein n=1 Tax=Mycobacterium sp. ACS4054 TaxID=1834119 RepID=UPI0007FD9D27|nr:hypothetical protein [Mycobacterium sp. ACS4054]OBF08301.1 hypothetical protein A5730_11455 [Mycobacterium sp. ACS4054]